MKSPPTRTARPITEPLVPPVRPVGSPTRRIGVGLDQERYVRFKAFVAGSGLSGEQVIIIALDRLMSGR